MKKIIFIFIVIAVGSAIFAESKDFSVTYFNNIRNLGMGGVGITSATDETILIYNPALLAKKSGISVTGLQANLGLASNTLGLLGDFGKLVKDLDKAGSNESDLTNILQAYMNGTEYKGEIKPKLGNNYLRGSINVVPVALVMRGFGVGAGYTNISLKEIGIANSPSGPVAYLDANASLDNLVGGSMTFGNLSVGAALKYAFIVKTRDQLSASKMSGLANKDPASVPDIQLARGMGANAGVLLEMKNPDLNVALAITDLFSSMDSEKLEFVKNGSETTAKLVSTGKKNLPANVSVGVSSKMLRPGERKVFWAVELHNVLNKDLDGNGYEDKNLFKKLHAGAEIPVIDSPLLALRARAGLNQGYPTFGAALNLFVFEFNYANFTEELSPTVGEKPNNQHVIGLGIKF